MANRSWSQIFMFLWFAVYAVLALTSITFVGSQIVLGILALLVAIALAFGK